MRLPALKSEGAGRLPPTQVEARSDSEADGGDEEWLPAPQKFMDRENRLLKAPDEVTGAAMSTRTHRHDQLLIHIICNRLVSG